MFSFNEKPSIEKKLKILFLIGNYGVGGKERQLTELIKGISDNYEIYLFTKNIESYLFEDIKRFLKNYVSLNRNHFKIYDIIILKNFIDIINPDVIYSFAKTTSNFALLINALRLNKIRLINSSIRGAAIKFKSLLKIERLMYNFFSEVVSNSHKGLMSYKQSNKKGRYVFYNGFNSKRIPLTSKNDLQKKLGFESNKFNVIMVASMTKNKDQETFILAAKEVLKIEKLIKFYLIGDGNKRVHYEHHVKSLLLSDYIYFTGCVVNAEEYFKASDLSILTSAKNHGEGISNSILESLACGTPVIATDNGATNEIVHNNKNGYLVKSGDYYHLSKKIIYLRNNNELLNQFSFYGMNLILNKFSLENMINQFNKTMYH